MRHAMAVTILSWATPQGMAVTLTLMFGFAFSKSEMILAHSDLVPSL